MKRLQCCRHLPFIFHSLCFRRSSFLFRAAVGFVGPWFVPALHYFLISLLCRFRTEHHRLVRTYPAHPFPALTSYHCPKGILPFTRISLPCLPPTPYGKSPHPDPFGPIPDRTGPFPTPALPFQAAGRTDPFPTPALPSRQLTSAPPAAPGSSRQLPPASGMIGGLEKNIGTTTGIAYLQSPDRRPPNAVEPQSWERVSAAGSLVPDDDALMRGELLLVVR